MDVEQLRQYCLSKKEAVETFPFGDEVSVYKVKGKVFALVPVIGPVSISLKCEPTLAHILRQNYPAVKPGYHMNKEHWNTVTCDDTIPDDETLAMIDHSYEQVIKHFPRKVQESLRG